MSTDILNEDSEGFNGVYLNEFWGGPDGVCHQITLTGPRGESHQYIQLTRAQMIRLVTAWKDYMETK